MKCVELRAFSLTLQAQLHNAVPVFPPSCSPRCLISSVFVSFSRWSQQKWIKGFSQTATAKCAVLSSSRSPRGLPIMRWSHPPNVTSLRPDALHCSCAELMSHVTLLERCLQRPEADLSTWSLQLSGNAQHTCVLSYFLIRSHLRRGLQIRDIFGVEVKCWHFTSNHDLNCIIF